MARCESTNVAVEPTNVLLPAANVPLIVTSFNIAVPLTSSAVPVFVSTIEFDVTFPRSVIVCSVLVFQITMLLVVLETAVSVPAVRLRTPKLNTVTEPVLVENPMPCVGTKSVTPTLVIVIVPRF